MRGRYEPLDTFRGFAVGGMALVNLEDPFLPTVPGLAHASWSGLTFADLVFPFFVLAVGLSTPLAFRDSRSPSFLRVFSRTVLLFLIGLGLNWLLHPRPDFWNVRFSGVLQRIAVVYFFCALLSKTSKGWRIAGVLAIILFLVHAALLLYAPAPGEAHIDLSPGKGLSAWLDRHLLPGRLPRGGYDPEGVLSTLSAVATGFIGVCCARLWMRGAERNASTPIHLLALGVVLMAIGLGVSQLLPVNKQLWTPNYALITASLGLALVAIMDWTAARSLLTPLRHGLTYLGRNALTFYVAHMVVIAGLMPKLGTRRVWDQLVLALNPLVSEISVASLVVAIALAALSLSILILLVKQRWVVRV